MKKILFYSAVTIGSLFTLWLIIGITAPSIASFIISKKSGIDIFIKRIYWSPGRIDIYHLEIESPKEATLQPAFAVKKIDIDTTLKQLRGPTLTIDRIEMKDILINVENFAEKDMNNWKVILNSRQETPSKGDPRPFLIKNLHLKNIAVVFKDKKGNIRKFPIIKELHFQNIRDDSADKIEKAILRTILRQSFIQTGLQELLQFLNPANLNPLKIVPKIFIPQ